MKNIFLSIFMLFNGFLFAQSPCQIDIDVSDSIGTYKNTKQQIIYERSFAGNSSNIYFSLANTDGVISLDVQFHQKSEGFIKANCLDANSKIYVQLNNGKIITLLHVGYENCGTSIRDAKNFNNRIMSGSFLFVKENYEELKQSPITFIRVKFSIETIDYPLKSEFVSEIDTQKYFPDTYFVNNLKCVE
jgi:hypothetical protein